MRKTIVSLTIIIVYQVALGQTFLNSYREYKVTSLITPQDSASFDFTNEQIAAHRKIFSDLLSNQIIQLDTLFKKYKQNNGFDFNTADNLLIVYQTNLETNLKEYIIISGNDTLSYGEEYLDPADRLPGKIVYKPFVNSPRIPGIRIITPRDSLLTLINKKDFTRAKGLGNENHNYTFWTTTIIIGLKRNDIYKITEYRLDPFYFEPILRKE